MEDWCQALDILDKDTHSSHGVYCGQPQDLPVVDLELALGLFPDPKEYREFLRSWAQSSIDDIPKDIWNISPNR